MSIFPIIKDFLLRHIKKIVFVIIICFLSVIIINNIRHNYYLSHSKPLNYNLVDKWITNYSDEKSNVDINFKLGEDNDPGAEALLDYVDKHPEYYDRFDRNKFYVKGLLLSKMHEFVDALFSYKSASLTSNNISEILFQINYLLFETTTSSKVGIATEHLDGEALYYATDPFPGSYSLYQQCQFFKLGQYNVPMKEIINRYPDSFFQYELDENHDGIIRNTSLKAVREKLNDYNYLTDLNVKHIAFTHNVSQKEISSYFNNDNLSPFEIDYLIAYWSNNLNRDFAKAAHYADMRDPSFLPTISDKFIRYDSKAYHPTMRIVNQIKAYRGAKRYNDGLRVFNEYGHLIDEKVFNYEQVALEVGACYAGLSKYDEALAYLKMEMNNTELKNAEYPQYIREGAENIRVSVDENKGVLIYSLYRIALDLPEYDVFFKIGRGEEVIKILKDEFSRYQSNPIMPAEWDRGYNEEIYGYLEELLINQ